MAHLTREERNTIDENPLGDSLIGVREALRKAERNTHREASQPDNSTGVPERPRLFVAAIGNFFSILSASDVSPLLASTTWRDAVGSDLMAIRQRVSSVLIGWFKCV